MQLSGPSSRIKASPSQLLNTVASEPVSFAQLPGGPIEAQKALTDALTQLIRMGRPEIGQIETLFALERQAQPVINRLLTQYVEGDGRARLFDWRAYQSALQLAQSLFQACQYFLLHMQQTTEAGWSAHEHWVLVQMFRHRKIEFLLRSVRYKKRNTDHWRQLHDLYRFAQVRNLLASADTVDPANALRGPAGKVEQQYLQILLLEAMNTGHYSPREVLWAYRWFARWCAEPRLQLVEAGAGSSPDTSSFALDLGGSEGLKRVPVSGTDLRYFDPAPLCALIELEAATLRDNAGRAQRLNVATRAGQTALLGKLAKLFAANAAPFERREERTPDGSSVQAIAGFAYIVDELRNSGRKRPASSISASGEESTIAAFGAPNVSAGSIGGVSAGPDTLSNTRSPNPGPQTWQVKDRSHSGCRMRGQVDNLNRVIPGSLIVIRTNETSPWTLSVVRWFRRLLADHVEIGVEYLGRKPRFVKMVANYSLDATDDDSPDMTSRCFAALYLPPSESHPVKPNKTILLPTREFRAGGDVTLLTSTATYRMRLNDPIQQQFEFVVTSFGVIDEPVAVTAEMA
jgi:hypothetical protein